MQIFLSDFIENLEDDFNTPEVLAVLFEVIKFINIWLREKNFNNSELDSLIDLLKTFDQVLWIFDFSVLEKSEIPEEIQEIFNQRNIYKKEKNFTEADKLREDLLQKWYKIIDNKEGSYLEKL